MTETPTQPDPDDTDDTHDTEDAANAFADPAVEQVVDRDEGDGPATE